MPLRPNMEPQEYLAIFLRRKWSILVLMVLVLFSVSVYCVITPDLYKSTTTIFVIPQRVPESYVRSTVSLRIEDRMNTIRQLIMSRTKLMIVINEFDLYKKQRERMVEESLVEMMRKRIEISVKGNDSFILSFSYENPRTAMLVASRLASFFIDENLKSREQQAISTTEFLDTQLQETKKKLEKQEEIVRNYKMQFLGELPQQMEANLAILRQLQNKYQSTIDAVRTAEDRKMFLETRLSILESTGMAGLRTGGGGSTSEDTVPIDSKQQLQVELDARRKKLAALILKYTELHPEVRRVRGEIEQLEHAINDDRRTATNGTDPGRSTRSDSPRMQETKNLNVQLMAMNAEILEKKEELKELDKKIALVQKKVDQSPRREQELIAMTRDYDNLKALYNELLRKKLDANISQNLVERQKGEQFQILDPANLPKLPYSPNRNRILGLAFIMAAVVGFGGAILLELFDSTIKETKDFRKFFDIPVLASIPMVFEEKRSMRQDTLKSIFLGGIFSLSVVITIFLIIYGDKVRNIIFH